MKSYFLGALACMCPLALFAEDEPKNVEAEVELGVILTSGNTEGSSYKGKLDVTHDLTHWKNNYIFDVFYKEDEIVVDDTTGEEDLVTTAEKYYAVARSGYKVDSKHKEFFVRGEYTDDKFSGFEYQYSISLGYSNRFFTKDNTYLGYSIGPGYQVGKAISDSGDDIDEESSTILFVAMEYVYKFSENAKFKQTIDTNVGTESDSNTKTKAISSISANINSSLAMKASYTIDYNSEVPADTKHADTQTAITLVYKF